MDRNQALPNLTIPIFAKPQQKPENEIKREYKDSLGKIQNSFR